MSLPRLDNTTHIADRLNELAAIVKTRSRANLTDACQILETIATRLFNALFGWDLVNLNIQRPNYPAADLGDRTRRIAIQVTSEGTSDKIKRTASKSIDHQLGTDFDRLIVFFLVPKKPGFPKKFTQPADGPSIETWDIADLLKQLQDLPDLETLARAAQVLDEEMGRIPDPGTGPTFDISRIIKYAPVELIGREAETKLLDDAWDRVAGDERSEPPAESASPTGGSLRSTPATHSPTTQVTQPRPRVLTFVALGGEGKTSLVAKWLAELAGRDWPGCDAVFAWSFYSQGTREQVAASSDLFLTEALTFFGDAAMAASAQGAHDKGRRLAQLVGERRALLILDGLEPLQYAPTSPTPGELRDQGLAALLSGLAASSHGLCVVTTRYSIPALRAFWQTTAPEEKLLRLSREHGVQLLQTLGVRKESGTAEEFETLVEDVKGHALTLHIMGGFLKRAHRGDIRRRDLVKFEKADEKIDGGHAFRAMDAYVRWMTNDSPESQRELAILRLLGLFDRPATADCLAALLEAPAIPGLTEALTGVAEDDWTFSLDALETARLLTVIRATSGELLALDTHPHIREYFAKRLQRADDKVAERRKPSGETSPTTEEPGGSRRTAISTDASEAWRAGHRRLYEHLCASTQEGDQPTLEALQPLYQAVAHGCHAGLQQDAYDKVYEARILQRDEHYSWRKLGAVASDIGAIACFFDTPWNCPSSSLNPDTQARSCTQAGVYLANLGRLTESRQPMLHGLEISLKQGKWDFAARLAINLSEAEMTMGELDGARQYAENCVAYADRSTDEFWKTVSRAVRSDIIHQEGRPDEADVLFREAEELKAKSHKDNPLLHVWTEFQYSDLLLAPVERAAWKMLLNLRPQISNLELEDSCRAVFHRAALSIEIVERNIWLLSIALDHLAMGQAAHYEAILAGTSPDSCRLFLDQAVSELRRNGGQPYVPRGLLARA